jgi:exodeoxyribonuclease-3
LFKSTRASLPPEGTTFLAGNVERAGSHNAAIELYKQTLTIRNLMVKIISYNLNGIRAAMRKNLVEWLKQSNPDIFLVQETKAHPEQVELDRFKELGYHCYFHSAEKKGYSGVAIFSKEEPRNVEEGCGLEKYDREGRLIRADYDGFSVLNTYFPSGSVGSVRQDFKMDFLHDFTSYIHSLKKQHPNLIICGDVNICHRAIDIHNPKANKKTSGFLPEERQWVSDFLETGFIDSFRVHHPEPDRYSWWSYRANSRARNKGWRIDYQLISKEMEQKLVNSDILHDVKHSDHCPTLLEIENR